MPAWPDKWDGIDTFTEALREWDSGFPGEVRAAIEQWINSRQDNPHEADPVPEERMFDDVLTSMSAPAAERGLAAGGPDQPEILLSVADVARIAAQEIQRPEDDDAGTYDPALGMVITEAGKARARAKLDAAATRMPPEKFAELRVELGLPAEPRGRRPRA